MANKKTKSSFRIIEKRNLWITLSLLVMICGFSLMVNRAFKSEPMLNYGIDFVGGSTLILKFDSLSQKLEDASKDSSAQRQITVGFIENMRNALKEMGLEKSRI